MKKVNLKTDIAIVTGSASGIGKETAILLAKKGVVVHCFDINEEGVNQTVQEIKLSGNKGFGYALDLNDHTEVKDAIKKVYFVDNKISILINCAAIISYTHIEECSYEEWERIMSVNVNSYYNCIKESGDYLKECGNGRIVNFSSSAALSGSAYAGPAYVTSKAAALGLTKYIAGYWAKYGIRCNAICPGLTATNIVDIGDGKVKGQKEHEDKTPLKRIAYPIDMANVVLFLVSEESSYMTGQTMHVNGGKYMYLT